MDSESGSEGGDFDTLSPIYMPNFILSTLWSLLVVAISPLLLLCVPFLRHKGYGFWPLGCHSIKELFCRAVTNVIFMVFGLLLLYWNICREFPNVFLVENVFIKLNVQINEMIHSANTCHAALLQWETAVLQELCMPVGIDVVFLMVNTYLLLHCHRRWARYLMVLMAVMFMVDIPTKLYDATFPAPEIHMVDPNFALVDEELLVALDGKNLKHGGSVAWVAYWGCAITANVDMCDKQFVSTFENGNVAVTFKSLDHFIPCYRDPPNPLKAQDYQCFEHVRIRVKEKHSIPGWSRLATQIASASVPSVRNKYLDSLEIPFFKREKESQRFGMNGGLMKLTNSKRSLATFTEAMKAVEADIYAFSTQHFLTENDEPSALVEEPVTLAEADTEENENILWGLQENELKRGLSDTAKAVEEELAEVEVTPDAKVRMFHASRESDVGQNEDVAPELTKTGELEDQEEKMYAVSPGNKREPESQADVKREADTRRHEAFSEKASSAATIAQELLEKLDSKQETSKSATVQVKSTSSRPHDIVDNLTQAEISKKKRNAKQNRQLTKESGPAIKAAAPAE
ncbi:unnamed protein product [Peronospora belbahrii]|uniref:Uncharacterized protein n=1 Tax=Peronospora belbahrii TaxID=622444 RepID=A0AAU9KGK5_9STRA|nr:unnamed protein product [Peronospora belbahrii]